MNLSLGNYELQRKLGAGGMGEVYLARHRRLGRIAAIKVLTRELSSSPEMLERFFAEAKTTSSIRHPGIVEVIDCDVAPGGAAFIVMELLEGLTLGKVLEKKSPLPLQDVVTVGEQVAAAVGAAHGQGVVHRDLKPDNIFVLLEPLGRLKILDFGIAKLLGGDPTGSGLTRTGRLMGTPMYMSPEQCRGAGKVDHRTDVYALGCILFQMAAGVTPFQGEAMGDLIAAHLVEAPPSLADRELQLPQELVDLVAAMLKKNPAERPASMAEVAARLAGLRIGWAPEGSTLRLAPEDVHRGQAITDSDLITLRQHLESANKAPSYGGTAVLPAPPAPTRLLDPGKTPTTFSQSAGEVASPKTGARRLPWLWAGAAVAVLGAAAAFAVTRARDADPRAPLAQAAGRGAETLPPEPSTVQVDVENAPPNVKVTVDGKPGVLPVVLARDEQAHALVFTADGMKPQTISLDGSRDRTIRLDMMPEDSVAAAAPVAPAPPPRVNTKKPAPRAKKTKEVSDVITDL